jgi:hypothetical protein
MSFEDWSEYLFNKIYNKIGDDIFDLGIYANKNFTWIFFQKKYKEYINKNPHYKLDFQQLSYNPNITIDIVNQNHYEYWNKDVLKFNFSKNANYFFQNHFHKKYEIILELDETYENIKYYEKNYDYKINYSLLSQNQNITWEIINKNRDKKWSIYNLIQYNKNITLDIVLNNLDFFGEKSLQKISLNPNITWNDIVNHPEIKWNFYDLSSNPNITIDIVLNHLEKGWSFPKLSCNSNITFDIIKKYNHLNWCINNYCRNPNFNLDDLENISFSEDSYNKKNMIKNICLHNYDKNREEYCKKNNIQNDDSLKNINMFDICYL